MKTNKLLLAAALVLLLLAASYGLLRTRSGDAALVARLVTNAPVASQTSPVDDTPLTTAAELARAGISSDEVPLAQEALRVADHEVDLAFDAALHQAKDHPPVLKGEAKQIAERLDKAEKLADDQRARVQQLTQAAAKAQGARKDTLNDDLAIAQEDLNLTEDEVDDAKQDLIRAGGDPQDRIQEMQKAHKALESNGALVATAAAQQEKPGLVFRVQQWLSLHDRQLKLWAAKARAESTASLLAAQHDALDKRLEQEKTNSPHLEHHAKQAAAAAAPSVESNRSHEESAALLTQTKRVSADEKALTALDKRAEAQKELASVYSQWIALVAAKQHAVLQRALIGVVIILGILLVGLFFDDWLEKLLERTSLDRRQLETLRTVIRVSVQVFAVLLILLVIVGPPGQLGTFLGLAGAGLTVALKDFIVGFLGWFVLMGKNGIRLGDWVEINGVTGEVVELGMFHTVLLETGNWTDSGHPTGRRVTFTNSFAIEGHYFNFSTSGQWLWDELQIVLPLGQDPYPIVEAIQKKVAEVTAENAREAEREWKGAAKSRRMGALSAEPAINFKPVVGGIEIAVRYITRANERYQLRSKLYQSAVELMGRQSAPAVRA
jgi:small-conductance mechanosensitive channel